MGNLALWARRQDPQLIELFLQDANKAIDVLDSIIEKGEGPGGSEGPNYSEEDIRMYIIHTHGVKTALANMNKTDLSAMALKLEQLGRDNNINAITTETPVFLGALKAFVNELHPQKEETALADEAAESTNENKQLLREKLQEIKAACADWNKDKARESLAVLREKTWSNQTRELLEKINEQLLHSDFDDIEDEIDKFTEGL